MEEGAKEEGGSYSAKSNRLGETKIEALAEGQIHHAGDYMWSLGGLGGLQSDETSRTKPPVQENKLRSNYSVSKVLRVRFLWCCLNKINSVGYLVFVHLFKNRGFQVKWKM